MRRRQRNGSLSGRPTRARLSAAKLGLASWTVLALLAGPVAAEPGGALELVAPASLVVGDRAGVEVRAHGLAGGELPVLVTPLSEGTPVEVVRGRLLRADAKRTGDDLIWRVPIVARTPGTAVFRVRMLSYSCQERCKARRQEQSIVVRVQRR